MCAFFKFSDISSLPSLKVVQIIDCQLLKRLPVGFKDLKNLKSIEFENEFDVLHVPDVRAHFIPKCGLVEISEGRMTSCFNPPRRKTK